MEVSAPHTAQWDVLFRRSGETERLACSKISAGTTWSAFGCGFRFICYGLFYHYRRNRLVKQPPAVRYVPDYAASGICTTTATSREEPHRGHICPGAVRTTLPFTSMSAGTVWVHIGQWT